MEIWAHRGCSFRHPENTLESFEAAAKLPGLTGIELDVQLAKDGVPVVIHDEKLDRTTTMVGYVKDWAFTEYEKYTKIPSLEQVLTLLKPYMDKGLLLNIELKNSEIRYEGMEQKVMDMVSRFGLEDKVIYSSFNSDSTKLIKEMNPAANVACLGEDIIDCMNDCNFKVHGDAVHPYIRKVNLPLFALEGTKVRVWTKDPLFPHEHFMREHDLKKLESKGIAGIFLNNPEDYLKV
ncbi:MAG: hypothetical protein II473_05855 [Clostridia bacterium]|nr:hypothetical protein [Clostridia bacterium]MBQ1895439.1 hypothetical protein [Clostridia bacterium]MBQ2092686.1 hypothetical protein [Clostridia bacterium]MBQ3897231.1 hypothetical protein [Clostridia bacterium]MCR4747043.1 hypothetical protein [Clostridiales bacterium]